MQKWFKDLKESFHRFKEKSRTENGGIILYPQFDYDLKVILDYVEQQIKFAEIMADYDINIVIENDEK